MIRKQLYSLVLNLVTSLNSSRLKDNYQRISLGGPEDLPGW